MELALTNRVAIVTGASRGLGKVAALALVAEGMRVFAVSRSQQQLATLQAASPEMIRVATCDLADMAQVRTLPGKAVAAFGRLDVVVNNAGIAPACDFRDQDWEQWADVFAVNVTGPAVLSQAAGEHFSAKGGGKIINVASTAGLRGKGRLVAYSSSKAALVRLTEALAGEWAALNIQVNAIAPGAFATNAQREVLESPELLSRRLRKIPARRMGREEEFGPLVCLLASPVSDFITGSTFIIDGGEVSKL